MTIVELMVAVTIAAIVSTVLLFVSLQLFGATFRSQVAAEMAADTHYLLRAVVDDIRVADRTLPVATLADANAPAGGWTTDDANNSLVLAQPATDASRDIIYNDATGDPYSNEVIYFIGPDGTFYRRSLKNDAAVGNTAETTCPPATASCRADRDYATHVQDMSFTLYDSSNNPTTDPALARALDLQITMERKVFGQTISTTNNIFTKLRN